MRVNKNEDMGYVASFSGSVKKRTQVYKDIYCGVTRQKTI